MRGNLPAPDGLAGGGASAVLRGWSVVPLRPAPRALHPLPPPANAAHGEYSDRLLGQKGRVLPIAPDAEGPRRHAPAGVLPEIAHGDEIVPGIHQGKRIAHPRQHS